MSVQSPARPKKKPHVLHNLGSCIDLLCMIMEKANHIICSSRGKVMAKVALIATLVCKKIPKKYAWPFLSAFSEVLRKAMLINPSARYTPEVESQFITMFNEYIICVQKYIGSNISADQLTKLSALLVTGLTSTNENIKQKTKLLWCDNFASTKFPIPSKLFETLKCENLPPANNLENKDSTYTSPVSFSGKVSSIVSSSPVTPGLKLSKLYSNSAKKGTPKSAKMSIFEMNDEDFVKVSSPSVNKILLTAHQAEKMKIRNCDIPALYSDLSQSMSQLPSCFATQDTLEQSNADGFKFRELFPPLFKKKTQLEDDFKIETVISPEKESSSKSYSDEDLNDILKDTSVELEKSLLEGDKSCSLWNIKSPTDKTVEKENHSDRKRKVATPTKKSIDDVRKSLKGKKFTKNSVGSKKVDKTKSPAKDHAIRKSVCKRQSLKMVAKLHDAITNNDSLPDSDEEIPSSQIEEENISSKSIISKFGIDSPSWQDRPKRNKRKGIDGYVYTTPTKKIRLTPNKNVSNRDSEHNTPTKSTDSHLINITESNTIKGSSKTGTDVNTADKSIKRGSKRGRRKKNISELQKLKHHNFAFEPNLLGSPTKVTRSGRRVVAPNKEMPEPLTPTQRSSDNKLTELRTVLVDISPKLDKFLMRQRSSSRSPIRPSKFSEIQLKSLTSPSKSSKSRTNSCRRSTNSPRNSIKLHSSPIKSPGLEKKLVVTLKSSTLTEPFSPNVNQSVEKPTLKENIISTSNPEKHECKKDTGNSKPNRKLFEDSPKKQSPMKHIKSGTDANILIAESPSQVLENTIGNIPSQIGTELYNYNSKKPISNLNQSYNKIDKSEEQFQVNARKRKRAKILKFENLDINHITTNNLKPIVDKRNVNCKIGNSIDASFGGKSKKKLKSTNLQNGGSIETQQVAEDENMNMLKEPSIKIEEIKELPNEIVEVKEPSNEIVEVKEPSNEIVEIKEPSNEIDEFKEPSNEIYEVKELSNEVKEPSNEDEEPSNGTDEDEEPSNGTDEVNELSNEVEEPSNEVEEPSNEVKEPSNEVKEPSNEIDQVKEPFNENEDISEEIVLKDPSNKSSDLTSFCGLIEKQMESTNNKEITLEKLQKTPESSPLRRFASISPRNKEDIDSKLPYIYVKTINSSCDNSPVQKQILRFGSSPSSNDKSPMVNFDSNADQYAVSLNNLEQDPSSVNETEKMFQKQESPIRISHSRLINSVSTPEIHQNKKSKILYSRAAAMVACAQQKKKTPESPVSDKLNKGNKTFSNGNSPLIQQRSTEITTTGGSPWQRYEPYNASPSNGILKRKKVQEEDNALIDIESETSPCLPKSRRVSFAHPVCESVEIPPSPKVMKSLRAQKKLDLTKTNDCGTVFEKEAMSLKEINREMTDGRILDSSKPIYPLLASCQQPLNDMISELAAAGMEKGLSDVLKTSSVITVGDIAQLTESELHMFPILSPKTEIMVDFLKNFERCKNTNNVSFNDISTETQLQKSVEKSAKKNSDQIKNENISSDLMCKSNVDGATDEELLQEVYHRFENNSEFAKIFCDNVPDSKKREILESLLNIMPYINVIDAYYDFLKKKTIS